LPSPSHDPSFVQQRKIDNSESYAGTGTSLSPSCTDKRKVSGLQELLAVPSCDGDGDADGVCDCDAGGVCDAELELLAVLDADGVCDAELELLAVLCCDCVVDAVSICEAALADPNVSTRVPVGDR